MKIVVRVGLGIVRICPAIKLKGVLSILPKMEFFSNLSGFNMKTDHFSYFSSLLAYYSLTASFVYFGSSPRA